MAAKKKATAQSDEKTLYFIRVPSLPVSQGDRRRGGIAIKNEPARIDPETGVAVRPDCDIIPVDGFGLIEVKPLRRNRSEALKVLGRMADNDAKPIHGPFDDRNEALKALMALRPKTAEEEAAYWRARAEEAEAKAAPPKRVEPAPLPEPEPAATE